MQVWAWCVPPHGAASVRGALLFPRRRYPPNRPEQSPAPPPLPDSKASLRAPGPGSQRHPPSVGLGALLLCPSGHKGLGVVSQPHLDGPGPQWQATLPTDTPGAPSPQASTPTPTPGASVLTPRAQHGGLLPAGQMSIWEQHGRKRAQTADTEASECGHRGRGLVTGLGESLTTRNPARLMWPQGTRHTRPGGPAAEQTRKRSVGHGSQACADPQLP